MFINPLQLHCLSPNTKFWVLWRPGCPGCVARLVSGINASMADITAEASVTGITGAKHGVNKATILRPNGSGNCSHVARGPKCKQTGEERDRRDLGGIYSRMRLLEPSPEYLKVAWPEIWEWESPQRRRRDGPATALDGRISQRLVDTGSLCDDGTRIYISIFIQRSIYMLIVVGNEFRSG